IERREYPGYKEFDADEYTLLTNWRFRPSVHAFEGQRHRVELEVHPAEPPVDPETGNEQWVVKIIAHVERNEEIADPQIYSAGDWKDIGQDPDEESIILLEVDHDSRDVEDFGPSEHIRKVWEMRDRYDKESKELDEEIKAHQEALDKLEREAEEMRAREEREKAGKSEPGETPASGEASPAGETSPEGETPVPSEGDSKKPEGKGG
ncbi:MAG: hypothetical protein HY720_32830, partial [Planctomycetes bacterium]|nr:hypothetical protein [Planctomycetota bacterium]